MQFSPGKPPVAKPVQGKQIGGEAIHIGDCQVWVEIYYLDSQTDYRECLPRKRVLVRSDELVQLCSSRSSPKLDLRSVMPWAAPLLFLLMSWLFIYFIWESY
jgi:hypothetical protein